MAARSNISSLSRIASGAESSIPLTISDFDKYSRKSERTVLGVNSNVGEFGRPDGTASMLDILERW